MPQREIITEWIGLGSGPHLTIMYFDTDSSVETQRQSLDTLWSALDPDISQDYSWRIRTEGRVLDTASGQLTDFWNDATEYAGAGNTTTAALPDATQLLIRWFTLGIEGGRRVIGRSYIPGYTTLAMNGGNVSSSLLTDVNAAAAAFAEATNDFNIWHRPTNGVGGAAHPVQSASAWSEWSVQRKRRG